MSRTKESKKRRRAEKDGEESSPTEEDPSEEVGLPSAGSILRNRRMARKARLIRIPPPYTWVTRAGWEFPRNAETLKVILHADLTLGTPESVRVWREENPWSTLRAGQSIPGYSKVLGDFSWAGSSTSMTIYGSWEELYVESSVAHSQEESCCVREPLRMMPLVTEWRGKDGLLAENVRKGCEAKLRLEFRFNGVRFDPNKLGANPRCVAKDYGFYWWRPDQETSREMLIT
mgnify:FL=1